LPQEAQNDAPEEALVPQFEQKAATPPLVVGALLEEEICAGGSSSNTMSNL